MKTRTFYEINKLRKNFLKEHADNYYYRESSSSILISAPHAVSQVRLGKYKVAEIGTLPIALVVADAIGANLMVKTRNDGDDANFDEKCAYREKLNNIIPNKIKYLVDIHGLAKFRPVDINLGINFGQNIEPNILLFETLASKLKTKGFSVEIDMPFCAGPKTISGSMAKIHSIWTIQIEVNCRLTNEPKNIDKLNSLIDTLIEVLGNTKDF